MAYGYRLFTTKYPPTVRDFLAVKVPLDESGVFVLFFWEVASPTCEHVNTTSVHARTVHEIHDYTMCDRHYDRLDVNRPVVLYD